MVLPETVLTPSRLARTPNIAFFLNQPDSFWRDQMLLMLCLWLEWTGFWLNLSPSDDFQLIFLTSNHNANKGGCIMTTEWLCLWKIRLTSLWPLSCCRRLLAWHNILLYWQDLLIIQTHLSHLLHLREPHVSVSSWIFYWHFYRAHQKVKKRRRKWLKTLEMEEGNKEFKWRVHFWR